jgi:O-Antigen ligase
MNKRILPSFLIVSVMQLTDVKFFSMKVGDIFSLALIALYLIDVRSYKINTLYSRLLIAFTVCLGLSVVSLKFTDLYVIAGSDSILKNPGILSFSRYVQYVGCVFFALYLDRLQRLQRPHELHRFLSSVDKWMLIWCGFFLLCWIAAYAGIETPFIDGDHRLRGGYVEGGPFGLFVCFYFLVRCATLGWSWPWVIILGALLIASQAKAAIAFLIIGFVALKWYSAPPGKALKRLTIAPIVIAAAVFTGNAAFSLGDRLLAYWNDYSNLEVALETRSDDPSLIMGRIAAMHIGPKMFADHPMLGVGFGNYSLARNNPAYRGPLPLPLVDNWDLPGLGGLVTFALESGVVGLVMFLWPFTRFYRSASKPARYMVALFMLGMIFGVQLYFQYIWLALALATSLPLGAWNRSIQSAKHANVPSQPHALISTSLRPRRHYPSERR